MLKPSAYSSSSSRRWSAWRAVVRCARRRSYAGRAQIGAALLQRRWLCSMSDSSGCASLGSGRMTEAAGGRA